MAVAIHRPRCRTSRDCYAPEYDGSDGRIANASTAQAIVQNVPRVMQAVQSVGFISNRCGLVAVYCAASLAGRPVSLRQIIKGADVAEVNRIGSTAGVIHTALEGIFEQPFAITEHLPNRTMISILRRQYPVTALTTRGGVSHWVVVGAWNKGSLWPCCRCSWPFSP